MIQFDTAHSLAQENTSIVLADRQIHETIAARGPDAAALFELYRTAADKDSFVAALIGRLLVQMVRGGLRK